MRHSVYLILLLLFPAVLSAQSLRQQIAKKEKKEDVKQQTGYAIASKRTNAKADPDTIYSLSNKKQHGWFYPAQIVDLSIARKHGNYLMFTRKNATNHWTKMESFDGYGNHAWIGVSPYILNINDPLGDVDWISKIKKTCIVEVVPDPSGENVIQERVYDKDMNLIYVFSHVPIGKNKYIGSYKDFYGLPAEMRKDTTRVYTYGTQVVITEDKWGNDSIIEFVDAKGVPKNNYDGVGMSIRIYDSKGNNIAFGSANHNGDFILDNWGNCGWKVKYDAKGFPYEKICMNQNWEPIKMPNIRDTGTSAGTIRVTYKYDNYGRCIEERYLTLENKADTNLFGAHYIQYKYNDYGNQIEMSAYDINGNLAPYGQSGIAKEIYKYDKKGRFTYGEFYDKDNKLNSTKGYLSRRKDVYDEEDNLIEQVFWDVENEKEDTCYYFSKTKDSYYERKWDGSYEIDSIDSKGRNFLTAYYKADGTPMFNKENGYHKKETKYLEQGKQICEITKYFNERNEMCGDLPHNCYIYDSLACKRRNLNFDTQGILFGTCIQHYDKGMDWVIGQSDANAFGTTCRAGGISAVRHYDAKVLYTQKRKFASLIGRDEFDEPDYVRSVWNNGNGLLYYYMNFRNGQTIYYDENNQEITDFAELLDTLPKAMSIEITDSMAYAYGIRDNDIIIRYGDSYQIEDSLNYLEFIGNWSVAQVFEADKEKHVLVSRVNIETNSCEIISIALPIGNPSQLGFLVHPIVRTQKQRARQQKAINIYCRRCREMGQVCLWKDNVENLPKTQSIVVAFPEMYRAYRQYPYPKFINDPSIILSYQVPVLGKGWKFGEDISLFADVIASRKDAQVTPSCSMLFVKDGNSAEARDFSEKILWCRFFDHKVSDSQYKKLEIIFKKTKRMDKQKKVTYPFKSNQLSGRWQTEIKQDNLIAILDLTLSKDGSSNIIVNAKMEGELQNGLFLKLPFVVTANNGNWGLNASILSLNYSEAINDCFISNIEIDGLEGEEKETKRNELQALFEQNKSELISNMDLSKLLGTSELIIQEVGAKELKVTDGTNNILFKKIE